LGEARRDAVPGDMGLRVAVQQQQRRSLAAMAQMNARARRLDLGPLEAFEHRSSPSQVPRWAARRSMTRWTAMARKVPRMSKVATAATAGLMLSWMPSQILRGSV